jgi:mannonate dehydratase
MMSAPIKLTMLILPRRDRRWDLARQMGIQHVIAKLAPELTGGLPPWDYSALKEQCDRYADFGFRIGGLEGDQFDMYRIKMGLDGRDEDIDRYKMMLENMGKLGIDFLCYNFMPLGWFRNRLSVEARGGALATGYVHRANKKRLQISRSHLWENYKYFIERVMPFAEDAGVRMGMHPDDPPVPSRSGIPGLFINAKASEKALALTDSPSHGLTFCQGTYKTMGEDVAAVARDFGSRGKIFLVHIRDVQGTWKNFVETFPETGDTDMAEMFRIYRDIGFDGYLRPDHAPTMCGSKAEEKFSGGTGSGYEAEGMVYTMGYIKGLLQATGIPWQ